VFAIGSAWLGGAIALDLLVHDLGLFATASEFHAYLTGFLGSGSPMSTVGTTLLVGLYQYGHVAVLLSALLAVLAVIGWNWYRPQILSATVDRENIPVGEPTDDRSLGRVGGRAPDQTAVSHGPRRVGAGGRRVRVRGRSRDSDGGLDGGPVRRPPGVAVSRRRADCRREGGVPIDCLCRLFVCRASRVRSDRTEAGTLRAPRCRYRSG